MSSFGGWDVLYRDDINPMTGLISMQDLTDIEDAYNALFFFEFCLRAWAADFKKEFWLNPVTAVDFLATAPPALALIGMMESASPVYRFLRLLRVLRLLRLLDRNADSVLFGLVKTDSMGVQLIGIGAEVREPIVETVPRITVHARRTWIPRTLLFARFFLFTPRTLPRFQ